MKKKFLSLALALVICLSLTVPALADGHDLYVTYPNGEYDAIVSSGSGDGWTYEDGTLTLNGAKDLIIDISCTPTIVLAPGSKNTLLQLIGGALDYTVDFTFKGTGELIIYNPNPDEEAQKYGAFLSIVPSTVKFEDGLTMTGGTKEGDSNPLVPASASIDERSTWYYYTVNGSPATYVRIAGPSSGFPDVPDSSPYSSSVKWAVEQGITNGKTSTTFGPSDTCTISHILTFLWRAAGRPNESGFESESVTAWANSLGIDTINLSAPCTRAQAVTYMWKAAGSPTPTKTASFTDVSASTSYAQAVSWAVEQGITNGTSGDTFSPGSTCTRGQIVTFLYRSMT